MAKIAPHIIDEIMQTSRIEEVIGEFVNLKRAGSSLKGLSPFTDEKTPSFIVSPAKQIFKCFSTGKGGTVVSFLMEKEHFSYPEALRWLADKYGIQIPEEAPMDAEQLAKISERESLYIINDFARTYFMQSMHESNEGQNIALSYFEERGFTKETITKFQLGYCLNSGDDFTKAALQKGYNLDYLEKIGLVKTKDDRHFDFFRGRVMFPIHSVSGRILGFGGRTLLSDKKIAKYFNSPESIIYNKSEILYGLYFAKGAIIKYDNCFLCEGYTDVISMNQAGIENVVSSSGTSLTKEQIKLIRRYTQNITILFDGDAAGIKASFRGIDLILEEGLNVKVVLFPEGEDPDSYSKNHSQDQIQNYLKEHTQDFISFKSDILLKDGELDIIKKSDLIKDILHSISLIPDQITRTVYIKEMAVRYQMEESILLQELLKSRKNQASKQLQEPEFSDTPVDFQPISKPIESGEKSSYKDIEFAERNLIRYLVLYGSHMVSIIHKNQDGTSIEAETSVVELIHHELLKDEMQFRTPLFLKIYNLLIEGLKENTLMRPEYLIRNEDQEIVQLVTAFESEDPELSPKWLMDYSITVRKESDRLNEGVEHAIYNFKAANLKAELVEIVNALNDKNLSEEDHTEMILLQMKTTEIFRNLQMAMGRTIL